MSDFWDNPFGGAFDFNGDGKEDLTEQWIGFELLEEESKKKDHSLGSLFGVDDEDHSWRLFCEDGSEYGIDPEDYETEEEYNEALEEAKYGWRDTAEDGSQFWLNPENYETEEEYNEALQEAKYGWRATAEDGFEFGLDPEDYETEEEYNEALEEAKYGWRATAEDGSEYGIDPEDYETEEEYEDALENARNECDDPGISLLITIGTDEADDEEEIKEDVLMQEISTKVVDGVEERYQFTWPDKKKSVLLANAPINKTLRPCREESVNFDTTENLYIEGDNLEVLKLLQETYLGKIKMIYIDPPYNTGNDFVYNDDFAESVDEYLADSGQFDEDGMRLVQNTESNGRFHTDWLNMIYPRLKLAKDLLTEDGAIFISIDDNEQTNICTKPSFVAETKGTMESLNLRPIEQAKISCAKKLFNEMSTSKVKYHDVDSYQSLLNIMKSL